MREKPQRIQVFPHPSAQVALGAVPGEVGPIFGQAIEIFADLIHRATKENESLFSRDEWNFIADANNGSITESNFNPALHFLANCSDFQTLSRGGDRWLGDDADNRVKNICKKLHDLDLLHAWAVAWSVQFFWRVQEINHTTDEWWTIDFRAKALANKG